MMSKDERRFFDIASSLTTHQEEAGLVSAVLKDIIALSKCERGVLFLLKDEKFVCKAALYDNANEWGVTPCIDELSLYSAKQKQMQAVSSLEQAGHSFDTAIVQEDQELDMHTVSMLAVPMLDSNNDVLGVIRLHNARDSQKIPVSFSNEVIELVVAVAGLTAVSLSNKYHTEEIRSLLASFVRVISAAIDERTPFNANHTRNMAKCGWKLVEYLNEQYSIGGTSICFNNNHCQQFMMSIWLHDMGKMVIPNWIMNKSSRLGRRLEEICMRLERISLLNEILYLKKEMAEESFLKENKALTETAAFISMLNHTMTLLPQDIAALEEISRKTYREKNGDICPWISQEELQCLSIEKGTLTQEERHIMEGHVVFTEKLLQEIVFSKEYSQVPVWAAAHHEYLDGTGYPKQLKGEEIPVEVRLLTILDIFDALTAADRPYKMPMALPAALRVLEDMAKEGKLDMDLVMLFKKSKCWENGFLPLV